MQRKLQEIKLLLRSRMHWHKAKVGAWLRQVLLGHYRYYGVPFNGECLMGNEISGYPNVVQNPEPTQPYEEYELETNEPTL